MDVNQRIQELARPIEDITCPIYDLSEESRPVLLGSGVLLRLADAFVLLTARHVLEACAPSDRYVGLNSRIVRLQAKVLKTGGPVDHLDIGVCFLDSGLGQGLPGTSCALPEQLYVPNSLERSEHLLVGYPCSKQPRSVGGTVFARPMDLRCLSLPPSDYEKAGYNPYTSILVRFDKENVWQDGRRVRAPDPYGMSGGGLWVVRDTFGSVLPAPKLAGVAIEWHRKNRRILATRVRPALEVIVQALPEHRARLSHLLQ